MESCVMLVAEKVGKFGWSVEFPLLDTEINRKAMKIGGWTYTTFITNMGVKIAVSDTSLFIHNDRVWIGDPTVVRPNEMTITGVFTPIESRGKGYARDAIRSLLALTDDMGAKVMLEPCPFDVKRGDNSLKYNQLVKWYKRLNFEPVGQYDILLSHTPPNYKPIR